MFHELRYGAESRLVVDVDREAVVARCIPARQPLSDPMRAVQDALATPIDFPPLQMSTTPGDRVTLAFDHGVADSALMAAGIVQILRDNGVSASDITILLGENGTRAEAAANRRFTAAFESARQHYHLDPITVAIHDSKDRQQLSYLAATEDGLPIYLNRALTDADVVVPISTVQLSGALRYLGVYSGLFPVFSDASTISRFYSPSPTHHPDQQAKLKAECDEAAWLLGALLAVQVVPGPCGTTLQIIAGEARGVERRGQQITAEAWVFDAPRRASVVLATIGGGQEQQGWLDFARALSTASEVAEEEGVVVLCTELRCRPGPSLKRLTDERAEASVTRKRIQKDKTPDAISADTLVRAREHLRIFLLSDLDSEVVEDLGIGYVADPHEIQRLCNGRESFILVQDAHRALVRTAASA